MKRDVDLAAKARALLFSRVASALSATPGTTDARGGAVGDGRSARSELTDFATLPGFEELRLQRAIGEKLGLVNPYWRTHEGPVTGRTRIDGRDLLDFSGYDYLGLNTHPEVIAAAKEAIDRYGISASGSRHVAGDRPVHRSLEAAIARHYRADDAAVFLSGYGTNVGVIGQLVGPRDLVITDAFVHNSAVTGAVLSGATRRTFAHNDADDLERILAKVRHKFERVLIVIEGLYSMDGDFPELPRFIAIKQRFDAWLMVDEAHALGVLGPRGHGVFEQFGSDPRDVDIWMGTASKTLAGCGGFIAGSAALIDYVRSIVGSFVFSVALPPVVAASVEKALELLHREPERAARLQSNGSYFRRRANEKGLDSGSSAGFAVAPVIVGDSIHSVALSQELLARGVNVMPAFYPAVPPNAARLRFFLSAAHSTADIDLAIDVLEDSIRTLPGRLEILKTLL